MGWNSLAYELTSCFVKDMVIGNLASEGAENTYNMRESSLN